VTGPDRQVALIDGGGANIASLQFALRRMGYEGIVSSDPEFIAAASHVVLPGVGAAGEGMKRLRQNGIDLVIPQLTQPVLGICLGLQLLCEASEEQDAACLGVLAGTARRFDPAPGRPVPHMGWNRVHAGRRSPLMHDIPDGAHFYFVHSYAVETGPSTLATADYGRQFCAVAERDNFMATQFHPERSGRWGAQLLHNFLTRC